MLIVGTNEEESPQMPTAMWSAAPPVASSPGISKRENGEGQRMDSLFVLTIVARRSSLSDLIVNEQRPTSSSAYQGMYLIKAANMSNYRLCTGMSQVKYSNKYGVAQVRTWQHHPRGAIDCERASETSSTVTYFWGQYSV